MQKKTLYLFQFMRGKTAILLLTVLFFISCKKELQPSADTTATADRAQSLQALKPGIVVTPGNSIQAAVNAANPGDVIQIQPGTYKEDIVVNKPGIKLVGITNGTASVIIDNPGDEENGITVQDNGDGFELYNVTVQNFEENGVILTHVDNFVLSHVTAIKNGEYGLFPIFCNGGKIDHCSATGHEDTGIYVGQSTNVDMSYNEAFANVNGLEIENCFHITATNNQSYDNVDGILVVLLPGLTVTASSDITLSRNHVYNNNHENFAAPGGGFEAFVPSGCGILIVGPDNVTAENNTVQDNHFLGIAVVSVKVLAALAGLPPEALAGIEPNPDGTKVKGNVANSNGTVQPALPFPAVDLLWDGSGSNNCWSSNNFKKSFPQQLPNCN
jgi:parallel beta-helix repeat protein